jgi:hypothetical protein
MYSKTTKAIISKIHQLGVDSEDESQSYITESMEELASQIVIGDIKRKAASFEDEVKAIADAFRVYSVGASIEWQFIAATWLSKNGEGITPPSDVALKARALVSLIATKKEWTPALKAGFFETLRELQEIGEELKG